MIITIIYKDVLLWNIVMEIRERIKKRICELKEIRDNSESSGTKSRYSFVIAELGFLLEE